MIFAPLFEHTVKNDTHNNQRGFIGPCYQHKPYFRIFLAHFLSTDEKGIRHKKTNSRLFFRIAGINIALYKFRFKMTFFYFGLNFVHFFDNLLRGGKPIDAKIKSMTEFENFGQHFSLFKLRFLANYICL